MRVESLGFGVLGFGFRVKVLGCRVWGVGSVPNLRMQASDGGGGTGKTNLQSSSVKPLAGRV